MKAFGSAFGNKPLPLHYYLGLDERVNPLDELAIDNFTFYQACAHGKQDITFAFLVSGFDINANEVNGANSYGYTGLHYAAGNGDTTLVALLCQNGALADATSTNGGITPLMLAFGAGHFETVRLLIQHGADPKRPDEVGDPAIFYAAKHPICMEVAKGLTNLDLASLRNNAGDTLLHCAARNKDSRNACLYLCEMGGIDVNAQAESTGETALHNAARVNDLDVVKALMAKGADPQITSNTGLTPVNVKGSRHSQFMLRCVKETNKTSLDRLTRPDASNLGNLDGAQIRHFLVAFTVPNVILYFGAHLPAYIGFLALACSAVGFGMVAKFALGQKKRNISTAGWFSGALTFGSYVLVTRVFPVFEEFHENGRMYTGLWWAVTACMYVSYAKAVLADPGAVQSSPELRETIIAAVAKDGEAAVKREHYDVSTLVRKPLRSKHCKMTHYTVCRFDHYCVWTGNAIGGGNHRPFVLYCAFQTVSQILVAYTTINSLFYYGPVAARYEGTGFVAMWNWMLTPPDNTLVTYFLIFYNSFVFLFVSTVVLSQLWYATRNVTSNEVWFATRYSWMFQLGSRAYSMYDKGTWENLKDFFWSGNLCVEHFTVPKMNEHLAKITRQYAAKMKSQQAGRFGAAMNQPGNEVPTSVGPATAGAAGAAAAEPHSATSATSAGSWQSEQDGAASPATPSEALNEMQMLLPQDKQEEMRTLQAMLQEMIAGANEPTVPASVTDEQQRQGLLRKVKMMHRHYMMAARQAGSPAGSGAAAAAGSPASKTD